MGCSCGNKVIENKDLGLCATCNKARRKAESDALKPKKAFKPIKPISDKKKIAQAAKIATYKQMDETTPHYCSGCGRGGIPLSHSHIIPVGQYPEFEATLENLVYDCLMPNENRPEAGFKSCHDIWEHGTWDEAKLLNNFQERLNIVLKLCPVYFNKITTK